MKKLTFFVAVAIAISFQTTAIFGQSRPVTPITKPTVTKAPIAEPTPTPKPVEVSPAQKFFDEGLKCDAKDYDCQISNYTKAINLDLKTKDVFKNRANAYLGRSDFDKAVEDLTRIIELDKNDAQSYKTRGLAYSAMPDNKGLEAAIKDFTSAIELEPKDADAYNKRGEVLLKMNQTEKAMADFDKVISLNPNNADVYLNRGKLSLKQRDYDKAIEYFSKAVAVKPVSEVYLNRGNAYAGQKKYDLAISDFNKVIELEPKNAEVYASRAAIYEKDKKYDEAIRDYTKAIELDPKNAASYEKRGYIYYAVKKQYDKAIEDANKAIEIAPERHLPYLIRGVSDVTSTKSDVQYKKDYELYKSLSLKNANAEVLANPQSVEAYINRGSAYTINGQYSSAINDYSKAIEIAPNFFDAYKQRAVAYSANNQFDLAINDYNKVIDLEPNSSSNYYSRGFFYLYISKQSSLAINDFSKAIELATDSSEQSNSYASRASAYMANGDYESAMNDTIKAVKINPIYSYLFPSMASKFEFEKKQLQSALEVYNKYIETLPNSADAYLKRAALIHRYGYDFVDAMRYPNVAEIVNAEKRKNAEFFAQNLTSAINNLRKSFELEPNDEAQYYLGALYQFSMFTDEKVMKASTEAYQKCIQMAGKWKENCETSLSNLPSSMEANIEREKKEKKEKRNQAILQVMGAVTKGLETYNNARQNSQTPPPQTTNTPPTNNSGGQSSGANNSSRQGGNSSQSSINDPNMIHGGFFGIKTPPSEACVEREGIKNCWGAWQTNPAYPYIQFRVMGPIKNTYNAIDNTPNVKSYYWYIDFKNTSSNIVALNFKVTYNDGKVDTNGHSLTPQEHSNSLSMFHTFSNSGTISLQFTEVKTCSNFTRVGQGTNADGYQCNNK